MSKSQCSRLRIAASRTMHVVATVGLLVAAGQAAAEQRRLGVHHHARRIVSSLAINARGTRLAMGDSDGRVYMLDKKGATLWSNSVHRDRVLAIVFSPSQHLIATGSFDDSAVVMSELDGHIMFRLRKHRKPVTSLAFSRDAKLVAIGGSDSTASVWSLQAGRPLHLFRQHAGIVRVAFLPVGTTLVTAADGEALYGTSIDDPIRLHDGETGATVRSLRGMRNSISAIGVSPHGDFIVGGSNDGVVAIWSASTGILLSAFKAHDTGIGSIDVSPSGAFILTIDNASQLRVWNRGSTRQVFERAAKTCAIVVARFLTDALIATGRARGGISTIKLQ